MEATAPTPAPAAASGYPVNVEFEYREALSRWKTFFRWILMIPIVIVLWLITYFVQALLAAVWLMLIFRKKYPVWMFNAVRELTGFTLRVTAYELFLDDRYPSTDQPQGVKLEMNEPAPGELSRWLPLIKWLLLLPHYIVLFFVFIGAIFAVIIAWFATLFTGRYPRGMFDYVTGAIRWGLRVNAYGFLLVTDEYPPFRLRP